MPPEDTSGSGDETRSVGRRPLLGALAAAGLAGCPSGKSADTATDEGDDAATGTATPAPDDGTDATTAATETETGTETPTEPDPAVDRRIREHRTSELTVEVTDGSGEPVADADVEVAMQAHEFGFGTAVNAGTLIEESSEGDEYREYIPELFNKAVIENQMKWRFWESDPELADAAVDWLLEQGLDVRGHVCIWGRSDVGAIPSDVLTAVEERDAETIRERSMAHIEDVITHFGDDVTEWEVVNEAMHAYQLQLGVYGDDIDQAEPWNGEVVPWRSPLLAEWYARADEVRLENGLDIGLGVNDFNQFGYSYTDGRYQSQIEHLNDNAVQLDTVGLQAHVGARTGEFNSNSNPDERVSASRVAEEIDKWAGYGASVKITEFDTYAGDDWEDDDERAQALENYLRGSFSHPDVEDFIMWGFWDGRHWEDEAPLFYEDWSEKPAYDVWTGLVYDEWWTEESGTTDESGAFSTTGFDGEYEVTATVDGTEVTETVTLSDGGATVELSAGS
ncbi:Fibronectin type III domain protein [Halosimplex carlsbadense 2-9-1]|uniref:endo-1,4-beta-xylanase n=1 Tax=Halosimplex carlsbadense 2-9-1 TaxID=797114 RepID=M0CLN8_9EURY|nr:endo-1,4-beta-xylanase [Halosimplex carlsbadense]ELZ24190.1 Fibronectin type III domain protein [Halosimplex carlsbadense 2-9-1]